MSTSTKTPASIRQGGPGASHENAKEPLHVSKPPADDPQRRQQARKLEYKTHAPLPVLGQGFRRLAPDIRALEHDLALAWLGLAAQHSASSK